MHDGMMPADGRAAATEHRPAGEQTRKLLRAMERKDHGLLILPILVIVVLACGLILSDRSFWDSRLSFRDGSADELGFLTLNLILYIVFRHRNVRRIYSRLLEETVRSETLATKLSELKSILEVSSSVRSTDGLSPTLEVIVENARACLGGHVAALHLRNDEEHRIVPGALSLEEGVHAEVSDVPIGHGVAGVVSYTGRPLILSDPEEVRARALRGEGLEGMGSVLSVPLLSGPTAHGTLTIGKREDPAAPFSLADLQLLIIFADYAGHVIHSARLVEELDGARSELEHSRDALARAQKHLAKMERLPSIERMVSRLGHDLANPLTSIMGYSQLLQKCPLDPQHLEYVDHIFGQTRRCQEIIEGFLSYVRGSGSGRFLCHVDAIVGQALELERTALESKRIRLVRRIEPDLPPLVGNSFLLQEAVLHLIRNSEQALAAVDHERELEVKAHRQGERTFIEIADNGPGVPAGLEQRIFEPFFSTRPEGNAEGLGLSMACKIIEEHGGTVQLVSHPGEGARFRIDLPSGDERLPVPEATEANGQDAQRYEAALHRLPHGGGSP